MMTSSTSVITAIAASVGSGSITATVASAAAAAMAVESRGSHQDSLLHEASSRP